MKKIMYVPHCSYHLPKVLENMVPTPTTQACDPCN